MFVERDCRFKIITKVSLIYDIRAAIMTFVLYKNDDYIYLHLLNGCLNENNRTD